MQTKSIDFVIFEFLFIYNLTSSLLLINNILCHSLSLYLMYRILSIVAKCISYF